MRGNFNAPNLASPQTSTPDLRAQGRTRSFPHDLSINVSKRLPVSDDSLNTPQNFDDQLQQDAPMHSLWSLGSNTVMTPTSTTTPFPSHHLGNPNLPDMKPVMFPSDNPLAYPNQPMSTLEAQQWISPEQQSTYSSPVSTGMYNISNTQPPPNVPFDNTGLGGFGRSYSIPQQYMQRGGQTNAPVHGTSGFDTPQQTESTGNPTVVNFPAGDGYWSQMDRINGGRTGLTPGGINMDELFGGDGWNFWNNQ